MVKKLKTYKKTAPKPKSIGIDGSNPTTSDGAPMLIAQPSQSTVRGRPRLVMEVEIPSRRRSKALPLHHNDPHLPISHLPSRSSSRLPSRSPTHCSPTRSPTRRSPTHSPTPRLSTPYSPMPWSPNPQSPTTPPSLVDPLSPPNLFRRTPLFLPSDEVEVDDPGDPEDVFGDGDAQDILSGGRLSSSQVSEIQAIVAKMYDEIEDKAKQWKRSTESLLRVGNILINTKERRHGGNPWNSFHNAFEKDPVENRPHHEYVQAVIRPAYLQLIEEHGGQTSAEWKAKAKQLVEDHRSLKAAEAVIIAQTPSDVGKVMQQITKRWEDDLKWAATMNAHGMFVLVSGSPDPAASRHNAMVCGSDAMHHWATDNLPIKSSLLPLIHSYVLMATGQSVMQPKHPQPKDMHKMRKEVSDEIQRVVSAFGVRISRVPWGNLPSFLANHKLRLENWPALSEFPSLKDLEVDQARTESWKTLWEAFFAKETSKRVLVTSLSDIASANEERLPATTVLVSDHLGHALISVADTQKAVSNTSPPIPEQSFAGSTVAAPTSVPPGTIPALDLSSMSADVRHEQIGTTKKRKARDSHGDGRKRTKKSAKKDLPFKSSEFISEDHDVDEQVATTSTVVVPESEPVSSGSLSVPLPNGVVYTSSGVGNIPPLPGDVLEQLSGMDWSRPSGMAEFGMVDPLLPHLQNWGDIPPLGYPTSYLNNFRTS